jgi:SET domain-containing protein
MKKRKTVRPASKAAAPVKRKLHDHVRVKRGAHGLGLFATGPIKKGEVVAEYWGPVVTDEELKRSRGKYFFELENELAIDGKGRKNVARYINHSCYPNCEPMEDVKAQRVFIMARRAIKAGEDFGYDYGREYWDTHIKPIGCRCGCGGKGPKRWR